MGKWQSRISEIELIRTEEYGKPFDATITFKVVDGEVRGVRMMTKDDKPFTRDDYKEVEDILLSYGFESYKMGRYKNGELRVLTRKIKPR